MLNYLHKKECVPAQVLGVGNDPGVVVKPRSKPVQVRTFFALVTLTAQKGVVHGRQKTPGLVRDFCCLVFVLGNTHPRSLVGGRSHTMSTPLDLLKVGDFVALIDERPGSAYAPSYTLGIQPQFSGIPYEIKAISLPWVVLSDGRSRFAVDCRAFELQKMPSDYVKAMLCQLPLLNVALARTRVPTPEQTRALANAVANSFRVV